MNKKIFGIKISTILTAIICLIIATLIWLLVKYVDPADSVFVFSSKSVVFKGLK